jgi:hypothetical protein
MMRRPPCGCCDCIVASHDFNIDGADLGPKWLSEGDGDFYRTGGAATIDSPANGDFVYRYSPQLFTALGGQLLHGVSGRVRSSDDGDQLGWIVRLSPAGSFGAGEKTVVLLEVGSAAKISIWTTIGVTLTKIREGDVTAPEGEWHTLDVCEIPGVFGPGLAVFLNGELVASTVTAATVSGELSDLLAVNGTLAGSLPIGGPYCGDISGTPEWDDFQMYRRPTGALWPECPECPPCAACGFTEDFEPGLDGNYTGAGTGSGTWEGASGRLRFDNGGIAGQWLARCVDRPALEDLNVGWHATIYWDDGSLASDVANPGIAIWVPSSGLTFDRLALTVTRDSDGSGGYLDPYYRASRTGGTPVDIDSPTPAQGDRLTIQVSAEEGGTYTIQWAVNGSLVHQETGVELEFDEGDHLAVGFTVSTTGFDSYAEWDDAAYTCTAYYYYYYGGGGGLPPEEGTCCSDRDPLPTTVYATLQNPYTGAVLATDVPLTLDSTTNGWRYSGDMGTHPEGCDTAVQLQCTYLPDEEPPIQYTQLDYSAKNTFGTCVGASILIRNISCDPYHGVPDPEVLEGQWDQVEVIE